MSSGPHRKGDGRRRRDPDAAPPPRPFKVVVHSGSKAGTWGHFATIEAAAAVAARLRNQLGMTATVEDES